MNRSQLHGWIYALILVIFSTCLDAAEVHPGLGSEAAVIGENDRMREEPSNAKPLP
jgi:hypothetical protein